MEILTTRRGILAGLAGSLVAVSAALATSLRLNRRTIDWQGFKALFYDPSGRVVDTGNGGISHSEGQGYGMLMALEANDRTAFDALWGWTRANIFDVASGLHAWRYDPHAAVPVSDRNNATDGDLLIAWALALGAGKWGEAGFADASAAIRRQVLALCTIEISGSLLLLPGRIGFQHDGGVVANPSYYVWGAIDHFRELEDDQEAWQRIAIDGAAFVVASRFGKADLPADWVEVSPRGVVSPAPGRDPRFGYDAVRVPLYAVAAGRSGLVRPIAEFWTGLAQAGRPIPAWVDVVTGEVAPYESPPGVAAVASLVAPVRFPAELSTDYYSAVLQVLSAHARAGIVPRGQVPAARER